VSLWEDPAAVVIGGDEPPMLIANLDWLRLVGDVPSRMMYLDTVSYLPGDILVKVDRASMAVGLEARCPLLDHRVVELAWRLPLGLKVRDGQGKWLLRELLARHVPRPLFERPKQGFGVPLANWLRGPLRGWAEELLDEARLRREGFLDPLPIRRAWAEHMTGARSWSCRLWAVLMFQAWHDHWHDAGCATEGRKVSVASVTALVLTASL
jgi:asparagine synthase (glutamine-hydrolysing)